MNDLKLGDIVDVIEGPITGTGILQGLPESGGYYYSVMMGEYYYEIENINAVKRHEGIIYKSRSLEDYNENDVLFYIDREEAHKDSKERSRGKRPNSFYTAAYGVWKCEYKNGDWDYLCIAIGYQGKLFRQEIEWSYKEPRIMNMSLRDVNGDSNLIDLINNGNANAWIDDEKIFGIDPGWFDDDGNDFYVVKFSGEDEPDTFDGDTLVHIEFKD